MQKILYPINLQKGIFIALGLVLLAVIISFSFLLNQTYKRYKIFARWEEQLTTNTQSVQKKVDYQETYLQKLFTDKAFFERVVRERLSYHKNNDIVFKFETKNSL